MAQHDNHRDPARGEPDGDTTQPLAKQRREYGALTGWAISTVVHLVIMALLALVILAVRRPPVEDIVFGAITLPPKRETPPTKYSWLEQSKLVPLPEIVPDPVILHEKIEVDDRIETENEMDLQSARGKVAAISDIPLGGEGVSGNLGLTGTPAGAFGRPGLGGRERRALQEGGSIQSESAMDGALEWLARHQEPDGRWDGQKYEGKNTDAGITGLALLAFLGAGHTEKSGKHKQTVRRAVAWIRSQQGPDGAIGRSFAHGLGYHHAICGLALAEAYGMARITATGRAAQKAIDYSVDTHQGEYTGWRYRAKQAPDLSVTGWFVMQLKSARVARLQVPGSAFQGAIRFLDTVADNRDYGGRYSYQPGRAPTYTMTSVGVLSRQFMGWKRTDPAVQGGAQFLMESLPRWGDGNTNVNFYYWYYGTLVMFQMKGDYWQAWNGAMRDMLVLNQRKGGDEHGSWDPVGTWCARGGRVYSTAMGCLCLEVYYRYLPLYRKG